MIYGDYKIPVMVNYHWLASPNPPKSQGIRIIHCVSDEKNEDHILLIKFHVGV